MGVGKRGGERAEGWRERGGRVGGTRGGGRSRRKGEPREEGGKEEVG